MFRLPCCYVPLLLWLLGLCQWCTVGVLGTVPAPAALSYRLYVPPCAQGNHSQTLERWNNGLMSSPSERSFFSRVNAEWYWAHTFLADGTMKYLAHAVRTQRFVLVDTPAQADVCIGSCTEQCPPFLDHWLRFTVLAFPTCRREACCSVGLWTEWLPNEAAQNREPCTLLVPYMHSVHAGARPAPWESLAAARRPVLLTFVGSSYRGGRRAFLRQFEMAAKGSAHPNAFESPLLIHQHSDEEGLGWGHEPFYLRVWEAYSRAVFSLQPPGDTATRRGFYDSWMHGCIPVITEQSALHYMTLYNGMLFRGLRDINATAVVVSTRDMYFDTPRLLQRLAAMPPAEVAVRQRRMRMMAYAMQYSFMAPTALSSIDAFEMALLAARQMGLQAHLPASEARGLEARAKPSTSLRSGMYRRIRTGPRSRPLQ